MATSSFSAYFDALEKLHAQLDETKQRIEAIKEEIAQLENASARLPKHRFGYIEAYYRPDRNAWTVRFWQHNQKHIKQVATEEEAIELAKIANEIAMYLIDVWRH